MGNQRELENDNRPERERDDYEAVLMACLYAARVVPSGNESHTLEAIDQLIMGTLPSRKIKEALIPK